MRETRVNYIKGMNVGSLSDKGRVQYPFGSGKIMEVPNT